MTTPDHHDPQDARSLSVEERELAARLGRLGPVEGPSPALDARILAAAHTAAVTRVPSRQRRFAWLGIPPALVTGVGVAAAAVLALGVVWQVRPQYGGLAVQGEADAGEEIILIAPPSDASSAPARAAPPPPPAPPAPEPAPVARRAAPTAPTARTTEATASQPARQSVAAPVAAPAPAMVKDADAALALQSAAPTREAAADASAAASEEAFVPEPPEAYRRATYTTAARADAERRERSAAQKAAPAAAAQESTTLDRIEVTGSRIRNADADIDWSRVPVSEDARLAPVEWLERIRARHDADDAGNARASLKLFQREYPRVRLPDDLRALLTDPKQ